MTAPDTPPLVIDFGGGVLGALQRHADPNSVHVLLSHLHADHCLDLPGLFVWRRYHPSPAPERGVMYGPANTWARLGAASSPEGGEIDDFSDIFDIRHWVDNQAVQIGSLDGEPRLVCHPTESYGMRITDPSGATFVYSGDTGVLRRARRPGARRRRFPVRGVVDASPSRPPKLHLSGTEAGRAAARAGVAELLLTHIPPWTSREDVISEAKAEFDGPVHAVVCG